MIRFAWLIAMMVMLTGCSILSPIKTEQPNSYVLNKVPTHVEQERYRAKTILVALPDVRPVIDTTQMAYTTKQYGVAYFSHNQWAETPSQMMLPLIVQTLMKAHIYHAVVTAPFSGHVDYILNTQIDQLQQNYTQTPAVLQFSLRAELVRVSSSRVVAMKQFRVSLPIYRQTPYDGVRVANNAVAEVLAELADFCGDHA